MVIDTNLLIYALMGIIAILTILVMRLEFRIKKLLSGKNGKSLEGTIVNIRKALEDLGALHDKTQKHTKNLDERMRKSIKRAETVRFNPFKGTGSGGNQSFATALLDEEGSGVVISSIYSRERVSVFAKPIKNYTSEHELSGEEKEVVHRARG